LAMIGARARVYFDAEANARRLKRVRPGADAQIKGDARDLAGRTVGVSGKTIDYASKVLNKGVQQVIKACDDGTIAVSLAAKVADLPPKAQRSLLQGGKAAMISALRESGTKPPSALPRDFEAVLKRARAVLAAVREAQDVEEVIREAAVEDASLREHANEVSSVGRTLLEWARRVETTLSSRSRLEVVSAQHPYQNGTGRATEAHPLARAVHHSSQDVAAQ
jgi:hypothetical protein